LKKHNIDFNKCFFVIGIIIIAFFIFIKVLQAKDILVSKENFTAFRISPEMLFNLKAISQKYNIDFCEIVTYFGAENNFNDENFAADKIEQNFIMKYDSIKNKYKNKNINLYYDIISSIFNEIKCFPIQKKEDEKEANYIYGNSWGVERTYGGKRTHQGCDIMDRDNIRGRIPIVSMTDGKIENIGWNEKGGWRVGIRSKSGIYYYYAHLDSFADGLNKGDEISFGKLLGYMGDTGYSKEEGTKGNFQVHLHIGIALEDRLYNEEWWINPYPFLRLIENSQ